MGVFFTALVLSLICLLLTSPALGKAAHRLYAILSNLFVLVLTASTDLRKIFPILPELPGRYNWTGKILELLVSVIAISLLMRIEGWHREEFGLKLSFAPGTGKDVLRFLLPVLLLETLVLYVLVPGQTPTLEDHLFQLFVPGLTEELAFRGVLMALIDRAFLGRMRVLGADLGWSAVATSLLFGLWHGLDVSAHFTISLDVAPMIIPTAGGFVLAWCRARSGSLLLPVIAHAGMNETANLIALIKSEWATR
jgi:uncharacterized protein